MSIWRAVRNELSGAWRSLRYDLRRRRATAPGQTEYDAFAGGPRRILVSSGMAALVLGGAVGGYLGVVNGLDTLWQPKPAGPQHTQPAAGDRNTPPAVKRSAQPVKRSSAAPVMAGGAPRTAPARGGKAGTTRSGPPVPTPAPNCSCVVPPVPTPSLSNAPTPPASPPAPSSEAPSPTPTVDPSASASHGSGG